MVCASCGTENEAGARFCDGCGTAITTPCPSCGASNRPSARFCGSCGTSLLDDASSRAPWPRADPALQRPPGGSLAAVSGTERRLVSVLFADLVGFTTLAEGRDSEEVRQLLTAYFDLAAEVVGRHGGTIEKFIGDAVMAVWGAPSAQEDDAERAVRAGLELVDAVCAIGPGIMARAGILTGEAAVTLGAANQGIVAGDLVNTAARLQSVATPGTVLVGDATQRAASKAIAFEPAGRQALKGKAVPVPAWRALRVVAERGGRGRSDALEAPFVGRDDELRLLKSLFHATVREGRARLVSVIGPAGIGKSRLAWEFEKYLDGIAGTVWWHRGRSPAHGDGITFWALGEMVRRRAGLAEADDEGLTRAKLAALLDGLALSDPDRRWIEPALLTLLGIESGIAPEQLFGAWRTFFERLATSGPVVMVFEDLHWADSGTLDFIDHLLEWSRATPLYVLTLARPELLDRRSDWGVGRRSFTGLHLEPLAEPEMRRLLLSLVPGLPQPAVRAIVARAEGVPLYAVETVRMLVDDAMLAAVGDGTYAPTGDVTTLAVPVTLTALIASRLDGLEPADRSLILDAAVLGQLFTPAALAAVSGIDGAVLMARLPALARRELIACETDPRSPERGQYVFVQALIREVAYNTLALADRKARHLAAARYLESIDSDELAAALAGHYLAARDTVRAGPERHALAAQARITLRAAAGRAIALGSHEQAVAFLNEALSLAVDPAEEAAILELAGRAASAAAHHQQAEGFLRRAVEIERGLGDRPALARSTAALGWALLQTYRTGPAIEVLQGGAAELQDLAGDPGLVALQAQLARAYMMGQEPRKSIDVADAALLVAERLESVQLVADLLVTKGSALEGVGRPIEGIGILRAALELATATGLEATALRARQNLGSALDDRDPLEALNLWRDALAAARRMGLSEPSLVAIVAWNEICAGEWDAAWAAVEESLESEPEADDRAWLLAALIRIGAWRGQPVGATTAEQIGLAGGSIERDMIATLALARADVAFADGRLPEAREAALDAARAYAGFARYAVSEACHADLWAGRIGDARDDLRALDASDMRGRLIALIRTGLRAGIAALEYRPEALSLFREAQTGWLEVGQAWEAALVGIDMATLLDLNDQEVRAAAELSREILVRLGAGPFIERLDAALARATPAPIT